MSKRFLTPFGMMNTPKDIRESIESLSDYDLLVRYRDECRNFVDPFLFSEIIERGLMPDHFYMSDVERLIEKLIS